MAIGHCKHGEFDLMKGCPQCVAERKAAEEAAKTIFETDSISIVEEALGEPEPEPVPIIVKVRYFSETSGEPFGREYSYFSAEPLKVGDVVEVPMRDRVQKAVVTEIDIPESEIESLGTRSE